LKLLYKNVTVFYTDQGSGNAVVLLHGFLENSAMWKTIASKLVENNRVICIDLLGHGQTGCLGYVHTMETMADAVNAVLDHLSVQQFTIIGHSMGGYVALALAKQNPHRLEGLCLMNSTYEADTNDRKQLRKRAIKMAQDNYEALVHMSFMNLFSAESRTRYVEAIAQALDDAMKTPLQGYIANQQGMLLRSDQMGVLKTLRCKKLIIIGRKDSVINGEGLKVALKDVSVEVVEFSEGHMSHIENKKDLTYKLLRFIE